MCLSYLPQVDLELLSQKPHFLSHVVADGINFVVELLESLFSLRAALPIHPHLFSLVMILSVLSSQPLVEPGWTLVLLLVFALRLAVNLLPEKARNGRAGERIRLVLIGVEILEFRRGEGTQKHFF